MAETRHVFLENNALPGAWAGRDRFTIAETGFGTGLNFLAVWALFEATAAPDAVLDYVSFEMYPLAPGEILKTLAHWSGEFGGRLERMVAQYPLRVTGWHRVDFGRVRLTLIFDDVNLAIPRVGIPAGVDAWFLDGFAPAKNPQMWSEVLFSNMARLSKPGTTLASFTAAGIAKDGLRRSGFSIEKRRGYGRKRDMIAGRFEQGVAPVMPARVQNVAILGGGLAGAACAKILRERGIGHRIFETAPQLAAGASGNFKGIFNPRFSALRGVESDFYAAAYAGVARTVKTIKCGSLHLVTGAEKAKRFESTVAQWGWHDEHMRFVTAGEASDIGGVSVPYGALYLPDSGQVSPRDLVHDWAAGSVVEYSTTVPRDRFDAYDAVILACGQAAAQMVTLPIHTVRGQIIEVGAVPVSAGLKTNICFGGYIGACDAGHHVVGSTFQKWLTSTELRAEDTHDILAKLAETIPALAALRTASPTNARAALRCTTADHFPLIGAVPDRPGLYVSVAHGSHGMASALMGAHLIADQMQAGALCLPADTVQHLSPSRISAKKTKVERS